MKLSLNKKSLYSIPVLKTSLQILLKLHDFIADTGPGSYDPRLCEQAIRKTALSGAVFFEHSYGEVKSGKRKTVFSERNTKKGVFIYV